MHRTEQNSAVIHTLMVRYVFDLDQGSNNIISSLSLWEKRGIYVGSKP
jgi:hypothetical protein